MYLPSCLDCWSYINIYVSLDILFRQITTFIEVRVAIVFYWTLSIKGSEAQKKDTQTFMNVVIWQKVYIM